MLAGSGAALSPESRDHYIAKLEEALLRMGVDVEVRSSATSIVSVALDRSVDVAGCLI
jgi:hypothetical protein